METIKLGSMYFDGFSKKPGTKYNGSSISIGNTVPGIELSFVKCNNGLLVADHVVCADISREQLNNAGFIFGRPIKIDGKAYKVRSLQIGAKDGASNEWDSILDEVGDGDDIWHWKDTFFWGQETIKGFSTYCAVRGCSSARRWDRFNATVRGSSIGFRPVLEPLPPEPTIADDLIGSILMVYGPTGKTIIGILTEFTDYDLVFKVADPLIPNADWYCSQGKEVLVIDRASITFTKKMGVM